MRFRSTFRVAVSPSWCPAQDGKHILICKGAVEEIFAVCTRYDIDGEIGQLDKSHFAAAMEQTVALNSDGFRVVAVAYKEMDPLKLTYSVADEAELTLLGYIAFLDPPKESAREAIAVLAKKGVQVKVLTGDNEIITRKICHEVQLDVGEILLGGKMAQLSEAELADVADRTTVFAKLTPAQKEQVVRALRAKGHVVGVLGDGINDSPALKAADVGISVDTAVDIAKESADIILLEKSLLVLQEGVIEGRRIFGNITKYIKMSASSNFGNMFSVVGASIFLPFLPMAPIQVLTNNLLYDFSQTTIPTDNVDEELLASPRRWDISNIFKFMVFIGPISSIFDYATYGMMLFVFHAWTNAAVVSDRMVRRVAADADADHPHHQNREDPLHREPRQPGADRNHDRHQRGGDHAAVHLGGGGARVHAAALAVLAVGRLDAAGLCGAHASGEGVVRAAVGALRRISPSPCGRGLGEGATPVPQTPPPTPSRKGRGE